MYMYPMVLYGIVVLLNGLPLTPKQPPRCCDVVCSPKNRAVVPPTFAPLVDHWESGGKKKQICGL